MTGAMYAAIGGLKSHMSKLNVIGNNVANVNTYGYKSARMTFRESIYGTSRSGSNGGITNGGNNPSQVGYGCSVGTIDLNMSPSTYAPTGVALDCYITGEGFFMFGDKLTKEETYDADGKLTGVSWTGGVTSGSQVSDYELSRVGDFFVDADGYICNGDNKIVYGFARVQNPYYVPDATGAQIQAAKDKGIDIVSETIISTQLVPLRVPLQAAAPTLENGGKVVINSETGEVVDNPTITDGKPADGQEFKNIWEEGDPVYPFLNSLTAGLNQYADPDLSAKDTNIKQATVADDGTVTPVQGFSNKAVAENTAPNAVSNVMACQMREMSIDSTGAIMGTANGKTVVLGYLAMANADNPNGVTHVGGPYYKAMGGAGNLRVSTAGLELPNQYLGNKLAPDDPDAVAGNTASTNDKVWVETSSDFQSQGLEASSTDLAQEFADMVTTQRGYQANTRIVTVTDSMLEELVNMKR